MVSYSCANPENADLKKTILIVDDTPGVHRLLKRFLEGEGYRTLTADNGFEAIRIAQQHQPDLILLDIMMPGLDGFQVYRKLQSLPRTRGIHVIFISAKLELSDEIPGIESDAVDYLTKPFDLKELGAAVKRHLTT